MVAIKPSTAQKDARQFGDARLGTW